MHFGVKKAMTDTCRKIERYLDDVLGIRVVVAPWETEARIPLFLQDRYRFFWAEALNQRCLFSAVALSGVERNTGRTSSGGARSDDQGGPVVKGLDLFRDRPRAD